MDEIIARNISATLQGVGPALMTREDARAFGRVWYYTGKPCRRGHLAYRYVSTGNCCACLAKGRTMADGVDGRRVPKVVRMRYAVNASAATRAAWADYLRACVAAFEAQHGPTVTIEKV